MTCTYVGVVWDVLLTTTEQFIVISRTHASLYWNCTDSILVPWQISPRIAFTDVFELYSLAGFGQICGACYSFYSFSDCQFF